MSNIYAMDIQRGFEVNNIRFRSVTRCIYMYVALSDQQVIFYAYTGN